jgi:predicted DNA-binding transcriptional regulator
LSIRTPGLIRERTKALLRLKRAPSQETIFYYILETGKTMTVKEVASELDLTAKSAERAVAKLLEKGLLQRSTFREGTYVCDSKMIVVSLLRTVIELYEDLENRR